MFRKLAIKSADLSELAQWNSTNTSSHQLSQQDFQSIRTILSKILLSIKRVANLIYSGVVDQDLRAGTSLINSIADIENFNLIKSEIQKTTQILSSIQPTRSDELIESNEYGSHYYFNDRIAINILLNLCHSIQSSTFTQRDFTKIEEIKQMVQNRQLNRQFRAADDRAKIEALNTQGIYGSDSRNNVKIVIREVLQNAVDAVLKAKKTNPQLQPMIELQTQAYSIGETQYFDLLVADNGVGMNMITLYDKFLSAGGSGKSEDPEATGGFGIAKRAIQNTPLDTWIAESQNLHLNEFQSKMYKTTLTNEQFQPPQAKVSRDGTTILLARLPYIGFDDIKNICSYYSLNGVRIILNRQEIKPYIDLQKVKRLDDTNSLLDIISSDDLEKKRSKSVIDKDVKENGPLAEDLVFPHAQVKFFVKPIDTYSTGKMLVILNGQFQFAKEDFHPYLQKIDIICTITTDARPYLDYTDENGDRKVKMNEDYPVTPSRNQLTKQYEQKIIPIIGRIAETINKAGKSILQKGKNIKFLNQNKKAINIRELLRQEGIEEPQINGIRDLSMEYLKGDEGQKEKVVVEMIRRTTTQTDPERQTEITPQQIELVRSIISSELGKGNKELSQAITAQDFEKMLVALQSSSEKIKTLIDTLVDSKCAFVVENEFISQDSFNALEKNIPNTLVLWQSVLKIILKEFGKMGMLRNQYNSSYSPGIVFSKECLALHQRLEGNESVISINPVALARLILPDEFDKMAYKLPNVQTENAGFMKGMTEKDFQGLMPVERTANRLFHMAIHELTHFLNPDAENEYEEFHKSLTHYEVVADRVRDEVYAVTKSLIKPVREEMKNIISVLGRDENFRHHLKSSAFLRQIIKIASKNTWWKKVK